MRLAQVHRHVDVIALGLKRSVEDRLVHSWITGIDDYVGFRLFDESFDRGLVSRVNMRRRELCSVV